MAWRKLRATRPASLGVRRRRLGRHLRISGRYRLLVALPPGIIPAQAIQAKVWRSIVKRSSLMLAVLAVLAVLVAVPVAAQEGPRIAHQNQQGRPFSPAIQVGNMYWLSGKIGASGETRAMTEGRVGAETHNIMRAFQELLQSSG